MKFLKKVGMLTVTFLLMTNVGQAKMPGEGKTGYKPG
jgi:hypothetical protein